MGSRIVPFYKMDIIKNLIMKIAIVGSGYVGLVTGACFSEVGINVVCVDIDHKKIENLKQGIVPIYEPGLEEMIKRNISKERLDFSTNIEDTISHAEAIFISVGTPPNEDGSADLKHVLDVARACGKYINNYKLIVTKSTVPVGTSKKVRHAIQEELDNRMVKITFDVASNPEFLKEGAAIDDFMKPDRIVIGTESKRSEKLLKKLYKPFTLNGHPIIFMDIVSAEMTKYAANAMLATKISFINDIANLCEIVGANINNVREGIGSDSRIGKKFIYPGIGYGGSCFPKDTLALVKTAELSIFQSSCASSFGATSQVCVLSTHLTECLSPGFSQPGIMQHYHLDTKRPALICIMGHTTKRRQDACQRHQGDGLGNEALPASMMDRQAQQGMAMQQKQIVQPCIGKPRGSVLLASLVVCHGRLRVPRVHLQRHSDDTRSSPPHRIVIQTAMTDDLVI